MPTRYPTALPDVPESRWNAEHTEPATIADDATYAEAVYESAKEAETRTLGWIDHDYEDDLRGATATALHEVRPAARRDRAGASSVSVDCRSPN